MDDEICPNDSEGIHRPDWATMHIESDGGTWYVDVNCQLCGRSGCVGTQATLSNDINW